MSTRELLTVDRAFAPSIGRGRYAQELEMLRFHDHSGVYGIWDAETDECLYVGESHTGNLYDTITRHFRSWKVDPDNDARGRHRGGTTYNRERVMVAWAILPGGNAQDVQYLEIQRLQPRDNRIDGSVSVSPE